MEAARPLRKAGDTDAVTFSWADREAERYGLVRVATGAGASGEVSASGLAIAFEGREPIGAVAESGAVSVSTAVDVPLERWTVSGTGELSFSLTFEALTPPAEYGGRSAYVKAGGLSGYEQICRVAGSVAGGRVRGLGQRGHAWGNPDWDRIALTRTVGAWFEDGGALVSTVRGVKASSHADEAVWAAVLDGSVARSVSEARLSTTADASGRQIRSGLELWVSDDDDYPERGIGSVVAGSTLELGALRLDVAFFDWHVEGRPGVGRYDVIRRA